MFRQLARLFSCAVLLAAALAHAQKPALVQNVDEKGRVPFQQGFYRENCNPCTASFTVPAGQRLVVTDVSALIQTSSDPGGVYSTLQVYNALPRATGAPTGEQRAYLPVTYVGTANSVFTYVFHSHLTAYADVTSDPEVIAWFLQASAKGSIEGMVTGYLIPIASGTTPSN